MRLRILAAGILFVLGGLMPLLGSCGDDAQVVARQVRDYVQNITNNDGSATGALVQGAPPAPSGGPDAEVDIGTGTVLSSGGGSEVEINSDVPFGTILLAVGGAEDYYEVDLPAPTGTATILLAVAQDVPDDAFLFEFAVVDTNGAVGNFVGQPVEVLDTPTSQVQVTVTWSTSADINLQVTDPTGAVINNVSNTSDPGEDSNREGAPATDPGGAFKQGTVAMEDGVGSLNQDANAGCVRSANTSETVTWSGSAPEGAYIVDVSLSDVCNAVDASYILVISREGQDAIMQSESFDIFGEVPLNQTRFDFFVGGRDIEVPVTACGDTVCDSEIGEDAETCPGDCAGGIAECGDGFCTAEADETCSSCEADCGACSDACSVTGLWTGLWEAGSVGADGNVEADLTQEGGVVTGTGSVVVTTCPRGGEAICEGFTSENGSIEGSIEGDLIQMENGQLSMDGTVGEGCSTMSGTWSSTLDLTGTWQMRRTADTTP